MAVAILYTPTRWPALTRYAGAGRLEIDNHAAERSMRGIAVGLKNWLFAGSDQGGHRAASVYGLVETARLNGDDPEAWLTGTIRGASPTIPPAVSPNCCPAITAPPDATPSPDAYRASAQRH